MTTSESLSRPKPLADFDGNEADDDLQRILARERDHYDDMMTVFCEMKTTIQEMAYDGCFLSQLSYGDFLKFIASNGTIANNGTIASSGNVCVSLLPELSFGRWKKRHCDILGDVYEKYFGGVCCRSKFEQFAFIHSDRACGCC